MLIFFQAVIRTLGLALGLWLSSNAIAQDWLSQLPPIQSQQPTALEISELQRANALMMRYHYDEAITVLTPLAYEGIVSAQRSLARLYSNFLSSGKLEEQKKRAKWVYYLAMAGDPWAQFQLAQMYSDGTVIPKNIQHTVFWLDAALNNGFSDAHILAEKLLDPALIEAEALMEAGRSGEAEIMMISLAYWQQLPAMKWLINYYGDRANKNSKQSEHRVRHWLRRYIQLAPDKQRIQDIEVFLQAGYIKDAAEVEKWLHYEEKKNQVVGNNPNNIFVHAQLKLNVDDIEEKRKGVGLLLQAAKLGHSEAQFQVGLLYWQGRIVRSDKNKAQHWLLKSAQNGKGEALDVFKKIYGNEVPETLDFRQDEVAIWQDIQIFMGSDWLESLPEKGFMLQRIASPSRSKVEAYIKNNQLKPPYLYYRRGKTFVVVEKFFAEYGEALKYIAQRKQKGAFNPWVRNIVEYRNLIFGTVEDSLILDEGVDD